jgi:LysM repeat protein
MKCAMKINIMQKMASKYKKFQTILVGILISMTVFGCMTNSPKQEDEAAIQPQKIEEPVNNASPDFVEGLVPPANQSILLPYYVQAGDNLAKIGKKIYGDRTSWKKIAELNHLIDPNKIYAGDVIYYQVTDKSKIFAETYENAPRAKIIVKKGDTLTKISKVVFGRAKDWRVLWKENPQILNPDKIKEGTSIYFRPKALTADASAYINSEKEKEKKASPTEQSEKLNENKSVLEEKNVDEKKEAVKDEMTGEDKTAAQMKADSDENIDKDKAEPSE